MTLAELNKNRTRIFVDGMSLREISERSGVPLDTIRGRHTRGVRTLEGLTRDDNLHNNAYRVDVACEKGKRLLKYAIEKNLTMTDIANRSGVPRSSIYGFIYNDTDMSSMRLAKICGVVGCSMDQVMGLRR